MHDGFRTCIQQRYRDFFRNSFYAFLIFLLLLMFIHIDLKAQELQRSTSLETEVTIEGNVERIDYVNNNGEIIYAANKHYATVIKTNEGNTRLNEFFDASGKPARQTFGHYAVLQEYDEEGRECKITYLGIDHMPVMITGGYSIIQRTYNEQGFVETELYFDTEGKPVLTKSLGYGCQKEYNEKGRNTIIRYLDQHGEPVITGQGFAILHREYYEEGSNVGRVKNEFYFDEYEKPIRRSLGQYGVHKEYDEFGREIRWTFLDESGNPIQTTEGYATVLRSFYNDDSVKYVFYCDIDGVPISLSQGQYGLLYNRDRSIHYLNADGTELFNFRNFLVQSQVGVILLGIIAILISCFMSRKENMVLLFLYLVFIIYMTIMDRDNAGNGLQPELFWSYKQFFYNPVLAREIINNVFLFVPFGTILYKLYPRFGIVLFALSVSIAIEVIQYVTGTGLCEWDDVISNGIGSMIGFSAGAAFMRLRDIYGLKNL